MKSFLNFIRKNGLYAFINLFGLTVSLAFVLLLAVFVSRQLHGCDGSDLIRRQFLFRYVLIPSAQRLR